MSINTTIAFILFLIFARANGQYSSLFICAAGYFCGITPIISTDNGPYHFVYDCLPCPVGKFKSGSSSDACLTGLNTLVVSGDGKTVRSQALPQQINSLETSTCQVCPAGSYSNSTGSTTCSLCAPGQYSPLPAATSESTCLRCPHGTFSSWGAQSCLPSSLIPTQAPVPTESPSPSAKSSNAPTKAPTVSPTAKPSARKTAKPSKAW
jgi:hypothetical protein